MSIPVKLVWVLGPAVERAGPVKKTPHLHNRPLKKPRATIVDTMTATQQKAYRVRPVDRFGNPAPVQNPQWLTDNTDILSLEPEGDGLSCVVKAVGMPGTANVLFSADGDTGTGEFLINGTAELQVVPAAAVTVTLESDAPVEQS